MIEDWSHEGKNGIDWGVDWGLAEGEELPENVEDMTMAQYTLWQFITVLRTLGNERHKEAVEAEKEEGVSGLLVPENMQ
jgi:hypothetical protein